MNFRPAKRESVSLLIGLVGSSGSGKTYSAMRLAKGMAGERRFAVIDTEAGRACHYADRFAFDHGDLKPPFSPAAYADAIDAADKAGYPVIVVDSASHEHAGDGGLLDMQEDELTRMAGQDFTKRERVKMASWVKPKMEHKRMVQRLLQVRAHLILCFRAEEKIEMVKEGGQLIVRPKQSVTGSGGWIPVCEKTLPYELTASLLMTPDAPGIPKPIKLQEQHRAFFPASKAITEDAGTCLAAWARGEVVGVGSAKPATFGDPVPAEGEVTPSPLTPAMAEVEREILKGNIHRAVQARGWKGVPREIWTRHCGGGTWADVDIAALDSLYAEVKNA